MTWEELCEKPILNEVWELISGKWEKRKQPAPCRTWLHPKTWFAPVRVIRYGNEVYLVWGKTGEIKTYPDVETAKVAVVLKGM